MQLNRSECILFAFRIYATYEVQSRLSDIKVHSIIDKLNPNLRTIDDVKGQKRVREFYAMAPEEAYSILEAIAAINSQTDKLKLYEMNQDEKVAEEIEAEHKERLSPFAFSNCNIKPGEVIEWYNDSALASLLTGIKSVAGPRYFKYMGEWLNDIRSRLGM